MNRQQLYELLRLDPRKVADPVEFWALYATSFYERLFAKVDDTDLVEKMYNHLKQSPKLNRKAVEALTFFYKLRMDELENPDFWEQSRGKKLGENMKAKLVKESLNESISGQQVLDNLSNFKEYPSVPDIVEFIIDNWTKITGEPESEMYAEQEFHNVCLEIMDIVNIPYDEFSEIWRDTLEGREEVNLGRMHGRYNESLNESMSRHCDIYKARDGKWYLELADNEYGEWDEANTYGPFNSEEKADDYLSNNFSNPGGMGVDDSGDREVPTKSPNGSPVKRPGSGGRFDTMRGLGFGNSRW